MPDSAIAIARLLDLYGFDVRFSEYGDPASFARPVMDALVDLEVQQYYPTLVHYPPALTRVRRFLESTIGPTDVRMTVAEALAGLDAETLGELGSWYESRLGREIVLAETTVAASAAGSGATALRPQELELWQFSSRFVAECTTRIGTMLAKCIDSAMAALTNISDRAEKRIVAGPAASMPPTPTAGESRQGTTSQERDEDSWSNLLEEVERTERESRIMARIGPYEVPIAVKSGMTYRGFSNDDLDHYLRFVESDAFRLFSTCIWEGVESAYSRMGTVLDANVAQAFPSATVEFEDVAQERIINCSSPHCGWLLVVREPASADQHFGHCLQCGDPTRESEWARKVRPLIRLRCPSTAEVSSFIDHALWKFVHRDGLHCPHCRGTPTVERIIHNTFFYPLPFHDELLDYSRPPGADVEPGPRHWVLGGVFECPQPECPIDSFVIDDGAFHDSPPEPVELTCPSCGSKPITSKRQRVLARYSAKHSLVWGESPGWVEDYNAWLAAEAAHEKSGDKPAGNGLWARLKRVFSSGFENASERG